MRDLNYELRQLCRRNRDGSYATQRDRQHILMLIANQLNEMGFRHLRAGNLKPKHVQAVTERWKAEFRAEALNLTNTPHFANPGANVSNMVLNPDGTIRSLGGYTVITSTTGTGREGIDERLFRLGLRITF